MKTTIREKAVKAAGLFLGALLAANLLGTQAQAQTIGPIVDGPFAISLLGTKVINYSGSFNAPAGPGMVQVTLSAPNILTTGSLTLNGTQIMQLSDFANGVTEVDKFVPLLSSNTFSFSVAGTRGQSATLTVYQVIMPTPSGLTPDPLALNGGTKGTLTATLSPTPTASGTLNVTSSNTSVAIVPSSITFASGQSSVAIPVTGTLAGGSATITASANGGQASATVNVNAPPTVSITSPTFGAFYLDTATVTLSADAADSDGTVVRVDFYDIDLGTFLGSFTAPPYSMTLSNLALGKHDFVAKATDNLGALTTSWDVSIRVDTLPVVSLIAPANNAIFAAPASVALSATMTDLYPRKVDFYQGTTLIGTVLWVCCTDPYPYNFNWTNVPPGTYTLTAVGTNWAAGASTSAPVTIQVDAAPSVSLDAPANGAVFASSASIGLSATAADTVGNITKVDFYQGTTLIGTATTAPYTFNWTGAAPGTYSLTAVATNDANMTAMSSPVSITVAAPPLVFGETPKDVTLPGGSTPEIGASYSGQGSSIDVSKVVLQFDGQDVTSQSAIGSGGILYDVTHGLPDATHTVSLSVTDLVGDVTTDTWTFVTSDPAPNFYNETPRDAFVAARNPRIRVLLSGFNIVASSVSISLDGADVTSQADVGVDHIVFTPSTALGDGVHTVDVSATDANGAIGTKEWQFTVDIPPAPSTTQDGVRTTRTVVPQITVVQ